jgi:UDP-2-acetamido-2,6-beta-L-arabino-hexul-4-ose reductase
VAVTEGEVYRFVFPPNCAHAFQNTGTAPNLLVAFNTVPHDPATPDVYREMLIG